MGTGIHFRVPADDTCRLAFRPFRQAADASFRIRRMDLGFCRLCAYSRHALDCFCPTHARVCLLGIYGYGHDLRSRSSIPIATRSSVGIVHHIWWCWVYIGRIDGGHPDPDYGVSCYDRQQGGDNFQRCCVSSGCDFSTAERTIVPSAAWLKYKLCSPENTISCESAVFSIFGTISIAR